LDWNLLPDLLALAALVAVFASLLPRKPGARMQLWLAAWILIVVHFGAKILDSMNSSAVSALLASGTLDLAGIAFMWAGLSKKVSWRGWTIAGSLALPQLAYCALTACSVHEKTGYAIVTASGFILPTIAILAVVRRTGAKVRGIAGCAVLSASLILVLAYDPDPTDGLMNILAWVYLCAGILHYEQHKRLTAGVLATFGGFIAWAAVFPVSEAIALWLPHLQLDSTVYNVPKYVVAIGLIVTLLEDQMERSQYLALHDELTGLPNRRLLDSTLQAALARAKRTGMKIALFTIDLDDFKSVNDSFGHNAGDVFLCEIGRRFAASMRLSDTCARFGGDEFIVVADALKSRADAEMIAHKILATMSRPIEIQGEALMAAASIGLALYPDDATDADSLYAISDTNMYAIKHAAREPQSATAQEKASA
jgi:diguanylate cyclase (GGDEF)-like protein